jgi:hypothetical protein
MDVHPGQGTMTRAPKGSVSGKGTPCLVIYSQDHRDPPRSVFNKLQAVKELDEWEQGILGIYFAEILVQMANTSQNPTIQDVQVKLTRVTDPDRQWNARSHLERPLPGPAALLQSEAIHSLKRVNFPTSRFHWHLLCPHTLLSN